MSTDDETEMTDTGFRPDDGVRTVLLNALRDATGDAADVVDDERSRDVLTDAYRAATTDAERRDFERALGQAGAGDALPGAEATLEAVTDAVARELLGEGVALELTHEAGATLAVRDVALYRFARTREPAALETLSLSPAVAEAVDAGAARVAEGAHDQARTEFRAAVEAADTREEHVSARVLAAWACHWAGDDEAALPLVTEALERDPDAWPARMVGTAADHESPTLFRSGRLAVRAYLRVRAAVPDDGRIEARVRPEGEDWTRLSGSLDCLTVPELAPELDVALKLRGPLDGLPTMHAYYLAVGVVDESDEVPRNALVQPLKGPETADATETVRLLERDEDGASE